MKKFFKKKSNIFLLFLIIFVIYRQAPSLVNNFTKEGTQLNSQDYLVIVPGKVEAKTPFPPKGHAIAIFWATWCGPCKIEMGRLKDSVTGGKIPGGAIYAINPFESNDVIRKFLSQNQYPFTFIEAPLISSQLKVNVTPTTVFLDDGKVLSMNSGLSIFGIWRAEEFLD